MQTPDIIWIVAFIFMAWYLFIRKDKYQRQEPVKAENKTGNKSQKKR